MRRVLSFIIIIFPIITNGQSFEYPAVEKRVIIDTFYNVPVYDEYRSLENLNDIKTKIWIEQQNSFTNKTLKKAAFKCNSLGAIDEYSYIKYDNPIKEGDYYFTYAYHNNYGVPALFCQHFLRDNPSLLVDPSFISTKDKIILKGYFASSDSKLLAYQFSRNGSDWGEIKIINLKSGVHHKDHLTNIKFSNIAWKDDGFFYSKFPDQGLEKTSGQEVYYHKVGTEQNEDELIFKRKDNPEAFFSALTTSDERFLIINESDEKKGISNIFYIDYNAEIPGLRPLLTRLSNEDEVNIIDNIGDDLIAYTFKNGNNGMIVKINPSNPRKWITIIPEYTSSLLLYVKLLDDKIITIYQTNRKQQIIIFDYKGNVLHVMNLPFGFSVDGFNGEKSDKKLLYSYSGYTQPKTIYIYDTETFKSKPFSSTVVNFDYTQFETSELEYKSFDGTMVPMFMIYKKGINLKNNNPTLLKAYGGFGSISTPHFDPAIVHFLKEGGIFVFANIRGGGDKGAIWAMQGRGVNKQNSFDDFIAAAEFLISNNYTSPDKLAITGASNGGLVVGVAMTQRPELFKVAVPVVGSFDMIRFEKFTIGHLHADEYGSVEDSAGFNSLLSFSPLHSIKDSINYPATLIMTSENDDRVPPFHSYKFAAKLQNRAAQKNPILLRIEKGAGHYGARSSFKKSLKEDADMFDFILYYLMNDNN
ncbi:MAG: prolyl oligopeptidase family serine peptidase [Saprospiraceae bacterium]|nr:prolyl oligopeptidase family serine peptidase [Saprospiraceae bacterium]